MITAGFRTGLTLRRRKRHALGCFSPTRRLELSVTVAPESEGNTVARNRETITMKHPQESFLGMSTWISAPLLSWPRALQIPSAGILRGKVWEDVAWHWSIKEPSFSDSRSRLTTTSNSYNTTQHSNCTRYPLQRLQNVLHRSSHHLPPPSPWIRHLLHVRWLAEPHGRLVDAIRRQPQRRQCSRRKHLWCLELRRAHPKPTTARCARLPANGRQPPRELHLGSRRERRDAGVVWNL